MGRRRGRRGFDFGIGGIRPAKADVFARRGGEDHRVLWHQRHMLAEVRAGKFAQIDSIQPDRALIRVVESQQKLDDRGLAGT